jgi:RNA polymerase sigma factor (sigma-70 family)
MNQATARPGPRCRPERRTQDWVAERVRLAQTGDRDAWAELVRRFEGMLGVVVGRHRLSRADAADVIQTTWLRLAENLHRLQNPSRVGAWLATTARRECIRTLRNLAREVLDEQPPEPADRDDVPIDRGLMLEDRNSALWSAFARLPARHRRLIRMLVTEPQPSYEEIAATLTMPIGSIGPTRARAFARLRRELEQTRGLDDLAA